MKKEVKLARKINRFLRRLGCPRFLHQFGPKTYELKHHIFALVAGAIFRLSLRRIENLLDMLGFKVPTYSALCKSRKKIPMELLQKFMALTAGDNHVCVAIDSTGISKANPSHHYIKRIDRKKLVKSFVKQFSLVDIKKRTFVALRMRSKPRHDIQDAKYLLNRVKTKKLFGDTAYDAETLHEYCFYKKIQTIIKPRKNVHRGFFRKKQMKKYTEEEYHQRSLIEAIQGGMKRKYGGFTLAKHIQSIKVEGYCKAIAYNLRLNQ
jgi:transposase